jgi:hypothetical protein
MKRTNDITSVAAVRVDDLLIVELDDRLELSAGIIVGTGDTNIACNANNCSQNGYCPGK